MTVDDAGRRAGADLRERFDRVPPPPLATTRPRRSRSSRTAVLAGVAAVLALVLLVVVVSPWAEPTPTGHPAGTWKRLDLHNAFGPRASLTVIVTWRGRLLALGQERSRQPFSRPHPAAWVSDGGRRWERIGIRFPPAPTNAFTSAAVRGRVIVATTTNGNAGSIWRSTDGAHWRLVEQAVPTGPITYVVSRRPGGFVAAGQSPTGFSIALASRDGRRWSGTGATRDVDFRTGLYPGAPLGRGFVSLWGAQPGTERPLVYRSRDRIRWDRIVDASPPERLALPLVGDHSRAHALGISFEAPGTFGGRLFSTRDGATWTEIPSFHEQMPVGNPDHLVPVGHWWVLGGNTGTPDGKRRTSMWVTPDLRRWHEMPASFRGPENDGIGMSVLEHRGRAIGWSRPDRSLWIWTPPDRD